MVNVLGIETSCDDTGVAIVGQSGMILSNCIDSQLKKHLLHGGIIPVVAKDLHLASIDNVAKQAFKESALKSVGSDIDAIAVTTRPGLQHSLEVGLNYARKLAKKYNKPLIPIHHMQAHSLMPLLQNKTIRFPFMTLLISGGHCLIAMVSRYNKFDLIGSSRDEAPGDLLDKVARRLKLRNLGEPFDRISGGASIELLAKAEQADKFKYFGNVPMSKSSDCDFSFSGYRSHFEEVIPKIDELWSTGSRSTLLSELSHICASLQRLMLIQMAKKVQKAYLFYRMKWRYQNETAFSSCEQKNHLGFELLDLNDEETTLDLVVSGGVAANSYFINGLRLACTECIDPKIRVYAPSKELCSDNGLMIAWNGYLRYVHQFQTKEANTLQLEDSVIIECEKMDSLDAASRSEIGQDLRAELRLTNLKGLKLKHPEFKVPRIIQ